jgi:hypothetical protein
MEGYGQSNTTLPFTGFDLVTVLAVAAAIFVVALILRRFSR